MRAITFLPQAYDRATGQRADLPDWAVDEIRGRLENHLDDLLTEFESGDLEPSGYPPATTAAAPEDGETIESKLDALAEIRGLAGSIALSEPTREEAITALLAYLGV